MINKFSKAKAAGILILIGGAGHLLPSLLGTGKAWARLLGEGWWNKIPPPWTGEDMAIQKAFWVVWGSFAFPFLILGALILYLANKEIKIPKFIGLILIAYAGITAALLPIGGMWIFLIAGVLLVLDTSAYQF